MDGNWYLLSFYCNLKSMISNTNWLHDGNVKEDQQEDWNNNIEKSVEPENIDSDVPIVGPDNEIGYNDFEHIANLHSI